MQYPVAVWNTDGVCSAEVPDLPGVITQVNSVAELEVAVKEAACGWMESVIADGQQVPLPTCRAKYRDMPEYKNCIWLSIDLEPTAVRSSSSV